MTANTSKTYNVWICWQWHSYDGFISVQPRITGFTPTGIIRIFAGSTKFFCGLVSETQVLTSITQYYHSHLAE
jgi:hypothetical protein